MPDVYPFDGYGRTLDINRRNLRTIQNMSEPKQAFDPNVTRMLAGLRSFSNTYTESTFRRGRTQESNDKLIRKIDMIAEEFIEAVHRDNEQMSNAGKARRIACAKGCAHCCHQAVGATIPEVLRIASYLRERFSKEDLETIRGRIEGYISAKKALAQAAKIVHSCPMLVDDMCSVFEVRPLKCRGFNSVDVEVCIRFKESPGAVTLPCSMVQVSAADNLVAGLQRGLAASGLSDEYVEFAPALKIALDTPDAADRYFAGEPIFSSASAVGLAG